MRSISSDDSIGSLVGDILSRDPHRVWSSSSSIVRLRDPRALDVLCSKIPEIQDATANLELGGALYPNKERLRFAIHKLEYYRDRVGCLCRLYPEHALYNPTQEEEDGNVKILALDSDTRTYSCQCSVCGALYSVEEGEYHYMWWSWKIQ